MKIFTKKDKRTEIEKEIDECVKALRGMDVSTDDYNDQIEVLEKLTSLSDKMKKTNKDKVSKDTITIVAGNLAGIALIIWHEKANVITTKALGFVLKGRV